MAMTGFDPQKVLNSIGKVESAYNDLMAALATDMQKSFVDNMANYWACSEAQKFFNEGFKPVIDGLLNDSYKTFASVVSSMNSAAKEWARTTGYQWTAKTFSGTVKTISTSNIKENINGVRGVDETNANTTANKLSTIATNASNALTKAQQAVQNCGFVGRNMEQQLVNSLGTIKTNINNNSTELTNSTKTAINNTVSAYGNLATSVESAFTVSE